MNYLRKQQKPARVLFIPFVWKELRKKLHWSLSFVILKQQVLKDYENMLQEKLKEVLLKYPGGKAGLVIKEQYRNMKEMLDKYPEVSAYAEEAIQRAGILIA